MRRFVFRLSIALLAFAMFAFVVAPAPAHAASSPLTARGSRAAFPKTPLPNPSGGVLKEDIVINAADGSLPTAGYLHLVQKGTTTTYAGTYTDNEAAGKKYPATAVVDNTGAITTSTVNTHLGKFVFDANGNATSVPTRLGSASGAGILLANPDAYTRLTYTFTLTPNFGYIAPQSGSITLTHDANGTLVNNNKADGVISALTMGTSKSVITAGGVFDPTNTITSLLTIIKIKGKSYVFNGTPDPSTTGGISGSAVPFGFSPPVYANFLLAP